MNDLQQLAEQIESLCAENLALKSLLPYLENGNERFLNNVEAVRGRVAGQILDSLRKMAVSDYDAPVIQAMNESLRQLRKQIDNPQES